MTLRDEYELTRFKTYERVYVKRQGSTIWEPSLYSYYDINSQKHFTVNGMSFGKNDIKSFYEPNEEYYGNDMLKADEYVLTFADIHAVENGISGSLYKFKHIVTLESKFACYNAGLGKNIPTNTSYWYYVLPISKFNPNDDEESRLNVLYIFNGQIRRFFR